MGNISWIDFICMCFSLILDLFVFFGENVVGESYIKVTEGKVVRLGDILEIFNKGGRIRT